MTLRTPTLLFLATTAAAQQPQLTAEKLFDPNHLVDVRIEMAKAGWDKLRHQTRLFVASLECVGGCAHEWRSIATCAASTSRPSAVR